MHCFVKIGRRCYEHSGVEREIAYSVPKGVAVYRGNYGYGISGPYMGRNPATDLEQAFLSWQMSGREFGFSERSDPAGAQQRNEVLKNMCRSESIR